MLKNAKFMIATALKDQKETFLLILISMMQTIFLRISFPKADSIKMMIFSPVSSIDEKEALVPLIERILSEVSEVLVDLAVVFQCSKIISLLQQGMDFQEVFQNQ
jgi:hypothetical protein